MRSQFVPAPQFLDAVIGALSVMDPQMTNAVTVSLLEAIPDPNNPAGWPAVSTHFDAKVSGDTPSINYDASSEKWYLVWPDPEDGWVFAAETITTPVTIVGYKVTMAGPNYVGSIELAPITVTTTAQTITLPYVAIALNDLLLVPAVAPLSLE